MNNITEPQFPDVPLTSGEKGTRFKFLMVCITFHYSGCTGYNFKIYKLHEKLFKIEHLLKKKRKREGTFMENQLEEKLL